MKLSGKGKNMLKNDLEQEIMGTRRREGTGCDDRLSFGRCGATRDNSVRVNFKR
jgi:hypothetical protein